MFFFKLLETFVKCLFCFSISLHGFRNLAAVRHAARSLPFAYSLSSRARHLIKNP
jgi:hypothetical protein